MSVNRVTLVARLGQDPKITKMKNDKKVANLRVATEEVWKNKNPQSDDDKWITKTEWHNITCYIEGLVSKIEQHVKKGDMVLLEGMLQTKNWEDNDGNKRTSIEIVLKGPQHSLVPLGQKKDKTEGAAAPESTTPTAAPANETTNTQTNQATNP